jgi:hypothetical protein
MNVNSRILKIQISPLLIISGKKIKTPKRHHSPHSDKLPVLETHLKDIQIRSESVATLRDSF